MRSTIYLVRPQDIDLGFAALIFYFSLSLLFFIYTPFRALFSLVKITKHQYICWYTVDHRTRQLVRCSHIMRTVRAQYKFPCLLAPLSVLMFHLLYVVCSTDFDETWYRDVCTTTCLANLLLVLSTRCNAHFTLSLNIALRALIKDIFSFRRSDVVLCEFSNYRSGTVYKSVCDIPLVSGCSLQNVSKPCGVLF